MRTALSVVQMRGEVGRTAENRARTVTRIEEAAATGARLVVLPELVVPGYTTDAASLAAAAEPLDGPTVAAWTDAARRTGALVAGGFCEREGDRLYNAAVIAGETGVLLHYRKLHLFDREKLVFTPGDKGLGVARTPLGVVGLCVCYDLRFVEVARALALQGAEIVAVPTAWVGGFDGRLHDGEGLIGQARGAILQANLNQIVLACASQSGSDGATRFLGQSLIADPYGQLLAGPVPEADERIATAMVDPGLSRQAQARSELIRPRADRRTDVYGLKVGSTIL